MLNKENMYIPPQSYTINDVSLIDDRVNFSPNIFLYILL